MFDVLEHIADSGPPSDEIPRVLVPGGRLAVTVPAMPLLWSQTDALAGHYRRYRRMNRELCRRWFQAAIMPLRHQGDRASGGPSQGAARPPRTATRQRACVRRCNQSGGRLQQALEDPEGRCFRGGATPESVHRPADGHLAPRSIRQQTPLKHPRLGSVRCRPPSQSDRSRTPGVRTADATDDIRGSRSSSIRVRYWLGRVRAGRDRFSPLVR